MRCLQATIDAEHTHCMVASKRAGSMWRDMTSCSEGHLHWADAPWSANFDCGVFLVLGSRNREGQETKYI